MKLKFKKLLIFFLAIAITKSTQPSFESNNLLNPLFMQNSAEVQEVLKQQGFKKIFFTTADQLTLCGLLRDTSQIQPIKATIIFCAGFYPGTKEGMASFYTLLADQPYNFLLFDARGHQESQGSLFAYQSLKNYGSCEYEDVIAAVKFLNAYNQKHNIAPSIIIHGICSGAFHCIKALDFLKHHDCTVCQNIKGIIFDSGWLQVTDIVEPTLCAEISKRFTNGWFSWLIEPLCYVALRLYRLTLKDHHKKIDSIVESIKTVPCPILFVHCINDPYVPITPVQTLVDHEHCPYAWWIDHDSHANFHMNKPEEYTKKITDFLNGLNYT
ncbi:hypothetical protein A3J41_02135 [candidate division TM6 bacterium RIFCSPHIGHO2_12_FULL_38_8]|nr:MAG: hypothetical protein A3J41_02135 [candidate division TM6 bacterium RIFCSPHIGHO2_12_FULL_38_8]